MTLAPAPAQDSPAVVAAGEPVHRGRRRTGAGHRRIGASGAGILVFCAAVLVLLGVPVGSLVLSSLEAEPAMALFGHDGVFANYAYLLGEPTNQEMLWRTARVSLTSTLVSVVAGYLIAFALRGMGRRAQQWWTVVLLASMLTGPLVTVIGWMGLFAAGGIGYQIVNAIPALFGGEPQRLLQTEFAMTVGTIHFVLPFVVLTIAPAMSRVSRSLEQVSLTLGAGWWRGFRTVTWPMTRNATFGASLLAFTLSIGSFVAAQFLGGDRVLVAATAIRQMIATMTHHLASALGVIVVLACVVALIVYVRLTARATRTSSYRESGTGPAVLLPRGVSWAVLAVAGLFLNAPLLLTAVQSVNATSAFPAPFRGFTLYWYAQFFAYEPFRQGIVNSLIVAIAACALALALSLAAGLAVTRGPRWCRSAIAAGIMSLPNMVPHIVIGLALLQFVSALDVPMGMPVLIVAHTLVVAPYILRTLQPIVDTVDPRFEEAAATLGSRSTRTFARILVPQLRAGLVSAGLVGLTLSFINLPVSLFLGTAHTRTLPLVVSEYMTSQLDPIVACYAVLQTIVAVLLLSLGQRYLSLRLLS
ncbi:ABC transporter permease [Microbacterium oleivorans]|uniref:ABC transporter permease n=1 Tax=Microbacterium oleivorans TaxID=273677 RepID=UPI00203DA825|nr:ABC transporter permease subunit [Microbacterium oleivorans]MCM3695921.1 ABC transporter permease subunit [Microbacterium oleivorans]